MGLPKVVSTKPHNNIAMNIIFEKITSNLSPHFSSFHERYIHDFPEVERREIATVIELLHDTDSPFTLEAILLEGQFVGFISYWKLPDFIYLEHFAIHPHKRSHGVGRNVLNLIQERYSEDKMLLEAEPPIAEIPLRRIRFYQRMGFELSDIPYIQPPYRKGGDTCPLKIMTLRFGREVRSEDLEIIKRYAYQIEP